MGGIADIATVLLVLGGAYVLIKSGKLEDILGGIGDFKLPPLPQLPGLPPIRSPAPAPSGGGEEDEPSAPSGGGPSASTGTNIYQVVGNIASGGEVTLRGGGTSNRDNLGYPCDKCARESTWIFKPGSGGDYSLKLGSHGDEGGKETLIELGNIDTDSGGGKWQCEGPHMTYNGVSGGSGSGPAIGGKPRVGLKAISWPVGADAVHHEIYYNENGDGSHWAKVAEFTGSATGCNAITCPIPGSKCQDTLRLDNVQGHQFISRSIVEIVPGAGATGGGGGAAPTGPRTIGGGSGTTAPAPTTPTTGKRTISGGSNYARARRAYAYQATPAPTTRPAVTAPRPSSLESGAIPIILQGKDFMIPVKINGKLVSLTYDTGASGTGISQATADAVGVGKSIATQSVSSGGKSEQLPVHRVTMQIGTTPAFETAVRILAGIQETGLLAIPDVISSGYTPVISSSTPRLVKRGTAIVAPVTTTLKPIAGGFKPTALIKINGRPLTIAYDTGGTMTYLSDTDAKAVGIDLSKPTGTARVSSAATNSVREQPVFSVTMQIGDSAPFKTNISVQVGRPVSTLAGVDIFPGRYTAVLTSGNMRFVPQGQRVVAAVKTFAPARTRFSNL